MDSNITSEMAEESVNSKRLKEIIQYEKQIVRKIETISKPMGQCTWHPRIREERGWDKKNI